MRELTFYIDESGNRHPNNKTDPTRVGRDWFGYGGFIIDRNQEDRAKQLRSEFINRWNITSALHMTDMLSKSKKFSWLGRLSQGERDRFWSEYHRLLSSIPALGLACIIDRPGYFSRGYTEKYGNDRWKLCKSGFDIAVERAAKYAIMLNKRLRIVFESEWTTDDIVIGYFDSLKSNGLEFDQNSSGKYTPLSRDDFNRTLTTIESKPKGNSLLQLADSYIYAISRGRYDAQFPAWTSIQDGGRIMDVALGGDETKIKAMGIKYYCFD